MPAGLGSQSAGAHADDALITIAGLFTNVNFDLTIPAWDGSAYLKISNARGALTDLTIGSDGIITWEYRSTSGSYTDPARLAAMTLDLLDPRGTLSRPAPEPHRPSTAIHAAAQYLLADLGISTIPEPLDATPGGSVTFAQTTITNPGCPARGTVHISDDGELRWQARTLCHPDGGLTLTDIAATITPALTRAQHFPSHA